MQQKIQFAGCVIHDPDILILDEPFSGLDAVNSRMLKDLLLDYRERGKTLVLSTHVMEQAEKLCDEIALINQAHIVLEGPIDEVKRKYSGNRLVMRGTGEASRLLEVAGVRSVAAVNGTVEIELDPAMHRGEFLRGATKLFDVESVVPHEATLDEVFVTVVSETGASVSPEEVQ
jgi:ABC-2 type transport system ATP-binding protein